MGSRVRVPYAPPIGSLAQLNRAFDYGSKGYRFESYRSHFSISEVFLQKKNYNVVSAKTQIPHFFLLSCGLILKEYLKIFRPINLLIGYYDNRAGNQGDIGINPLHRVSDMATPNETWCNAPNKSISIFVSERRPRCDRISTQTRSCLLPDSLKSKGLVLRRIMRSTSTDVARERRQGILQKTTVKKYYSARDLRWHCCPLLSVVLLHCH